jgi:DDE superfamily endonuclease
VDGHNSHYTKEFLDYAREHHIHVLCYPAHTTHVYQGLDVGVFGVVKLYWTQERNKCLREKGERVTKENFLSIYGAAHIRALTPETIRSAFRKTGAWPFDPGVVTAEMMAPSLATSCQGSLPLPQPSPIRAIASMLRQLAHPQDGSDDDTASESDTDSDAMDVDTPDVPTASNNPFVPAPVRSAFDNLASTSASFLTNCSPLRSAYHLPPLTSVGFSPTRPRERYRDLLASEPETARERLMQEALQDADTRYMSHKGMLRGMQASAILQEAYCDSAQAQLATQENKKKKKGNEKLMGDGLPRLLTDDDFVARVNAKHAAQEQAVVDAETKRMTREEHAEEVKRWGVLDEARKKKNATTTAEWKKKVEEWESERDLAKQERRRPRWTKPKRGKLEKAIPKPKLVCVGNSEGAQEGDIRDESGNESGNESDDGQGDSCGEEGEEGEEGGEEDDDDSE